MARYVANIDQQNVENGSAGVETNPVTVNSTQTRSPEKTADPYARMFAEWDLLPPQIVVRRIRRNAK